MMRLSCPCNLQRIGNVLLLVIITYAIFRKTGALQPLRMASDKGNNYHRYQPPVKSSVLKQLLQGRSGSASGGNGGNGSSQTDSVLGNSAARGANGRNPTAHAVFSGTLPLPPPTFEQRMRDIVLGKSRHNEPGGTANHHRRPSNVRLIETLQEYKIIVGDESNRVVAVRFYATYCKACQAVAPLFYRLATLYPDAMFIDVPVTESNASLHQGLGIPCLPYAHIYHPMVGLVEEQKLTRNQVQSFKYKLQTYSTGSCKLLYDNDVATYDRVEESDVPSDAPP